MDRSLLARATEGTDAPTPGYLYVDLAKQATANPQAAAEMANYLTTRLRSKQNPNIKTKCCKVIAKLCINVPRNQFRRCLTTNPNSTQAVKDACNFRGPLDPVQGDALNERVRAAAKEALDAIYAEAPTSEVSHMSTSMSGSYAQPSHNYASSASPSRMQGIGNPRYSDPRLEPSHNEPNAKLKEAVREAGGVIVSMIKDPLARSVPTPDVPRQGHSELPGYGPRTGRPPPGAMELSRQTGGQWTMASNRGPGAVTQDEYYKSRDTSYQWSQQQGSATTAASTGSVGGSWANAGNVGGSWGNSSGQQAHHSTPSITVNHAPSAPPPAAVQDGSYEKNLILELCPPGGMKAVPPPDKLANFVRAVPSLNADLVCPVLLDCLEEGQPWIIRAKALCVMEACLQHGTRDGNVNPYRDFFHACAEEVLPLAQHQRAAIRDPARRVLTMLGLEVGTAMPGATTSAPAQAPPNLLDFDDEPTQPPPTPPSQAPPPPPTQAPPAPPAVEATASNGSSMFGGMQVKSKSSGAPPAPAPTSDTLLDFMTDAPAAAAAAPATNGTKDSIFRDTTANPAPPSGMFADMTVKEEDKKTDSEDAGDVKSLAAAPSGGSAFGFMNEAPKAAANEPTDAAAAHAAATHAAAPNKQSFDPLVNLTPTSAKKKTMQMSPEQMQAMAYQQMMMQQQQQQMMMQMAYMQQQRGGAGATGGAGGSMPPMYPPLNVVPQQQPQRRVSAGGGASTGGGGVSSGFSFMDARPAKKDDKKFDFVKDEMSHAK